MVTKIYKGKKFFWWNEKQKQLADEVAEFVDKEALPLGRELERTRRFPWELVRKIGKKGWFAVLFPEEYGGLGKDYGVTGMCILIEEIDRSGTLLFFGSTIFAASPIVEFGTKEQKERFLPRLAKGESIGAITLTEPFAGSDAAALETTAYLDGDEYVLNGKKRFIANGGIADLYDVYCKTDDSPEARTKHRHLSSIVVEKGALGFTVEKVPDLLSGGSDQVAVLNFDNVRVPKENLILREGEGWNMMMSALNVERIGSASGSVGTARAVIESAADHVLKRVQFGQPVECFQAVQFRLSDMIAQLEIMRLFAYYNAYLLDRGEEIALEASIAKLFNSEAAWNIVNDALIVCGGDGLTKYYDFERRVRRQRQGTILAGSSDIMRLIIWRQWCRRRRIMKKEKPVLCRASGEVETRQRLLRTLAEDYNCNMGLHMTREDLKDQLRITDEELNCALTALEKDKLVSVYRHIHLDGRSEIQLAKATYKGLKQAKPQEYYVDIPEWVDKERGTF